MTRGRIDRFRSIVDGDVERTTGRDAWQANVDAGRTLAATIRTTLGPKGLDKMLISAEGKVVVTNDGARVLDLMDVDHPAAEMIVEVAADQAERVGDGTTTAVILAGELLARAADLIERGIHPTTITTGYRLASQRATDRLDSYAITVSPDDTDRLREIARTVVTGKWDAAAARFMATVAVEAALAVEEDGHLDLRRITRQSVPGGALRDSAVVDGLLIDIEDSSTTVVTPETERPSRIENASVALVDSQLTIETVDGLETVGLESPDERRELLAYEDEVYAAHVERIASVGADVVFCQQSIDDPVRYLLAKRGILAVERTRRDEFVQLGRTTGATHVGAVAELTPSDVGHAGRVERRTVGGRELTAVTECEDSKQVSLLLRGGPRHVVDELDRLLERCLRVLELTIEEGIVVPGGGAIEIELVSDLRTYAESLGGREQLVVDAFADALCVVPRTLAVTAGLDPIDALADLRAHHHEGKTTAGFDLTSPGIGDMVDLGVLEPVAVKRRAIASAEEAANMLVRVDDVIAASRRDGESDDDHEHDHGHGHLESTGGYPWAIGHSMGH